MNTNEYPKEEFSDMEAAAHALQDELEGIKGYKWMAERATCPKLKAIAEAAHASEIEHAKQLSAWIHGYVASITTL